MPTRNIVKQYDVDSYYHIYTRGVNKQNIFLDEQDYTVFMGLFKRYLSPDAQKSPQRVVYQNFSKQIELIAYALMRNHIHLFVYQSDMYAIRDLMRAILTSYSMYFNKKYKRVGPLFQSRYLASKISDEAYYGHISRYIHLNPRNWRSSTHTSLDFFIGKRSAKWIHPERVLDMTPENYMKFLEGYEDVKSELDEIKWFLANTE